MEEDPIEALRASSIMLICKVFNQRNSQKNQLVMAAHKAWDI